jgi:hypothetical protein
MKNYFWRPKPIGAKADINQHRDEQRRLEAKVAELESIAQPNNMEAAALRTYRHFLAQLLASKANAADRIGRRAAT